MGIINRLKVVLVSIIIWPIPILNGIVAGVLSSIEESITRSVMLAIFSSMLASTLYYLIDMYIKLPILTPLVLIIISIVGTIFAIYFSIYTKLNFEEILETPSGITSKYYVRKLSEVKYHISSLGFRCRRSKLHIKDEKHVVIYFDCGNTVLVAEVKKEWKYLKVVMRTV